MMNAKSVQFLAAKILEGNAVQCTVGLEGVSRGHRTVRQPDSQDSQTVLVVPYCSDLTVS